MRREQEAPAGQKLASKRAICVPYTSLSTQSRKKAHTWRKRHWRYSSLHVPPLQHRLSRMHDGSPTVVSINSLGAFTPSVCLRIYEIKSPFNWFLLPPSRRNVTQSGMEATLVLDEKYYLPLPSQRNSPENSLFDQRKRLKHLIWQQSRYFLLAAVQIIMNQDAFM